MGASGSLPGTPAPRPPVSWDLARVSDPRSPSAGILRTPIEVVSCPAAPGPAEPAAGAGQERDPRSPTPGISRTPLKVALNDSVESLVRQLGEAFGVEAPPAAPAEEPTPQSPPAGPGPEAAAALGTERERSSGPSGGREAPVRPPRLTGTPFSAGSKPIRRKTSSKIMVTSGGTGRSPLSILQDDNSPSALAPRQGKRHALGENLGDRKEVTMDLSRSLKSGSCTWSDLNKENQQCPFVEN